MTIRHPLLLSASLVAALALSACGKPDATDSAVPPTPPPTANEPAPQLNPVAPDATANRVSVGLVDLGSQVDENHRLVAAGNSFAPSDTIYASVQTTGAGHATLAAKWTYQDGQVVHEDSKELDATGPANTTFMISRPSGFPAGDYKVDISLDGKSVANKPFSVR